MSGLNLELREPPPGRLDAGRMPLEPGGTIETLARTSLRSERGEVMIVGDLFRISRRDDEDVHLEGDLSLFDGLGRGMSAGSLIIHGNVGHRAGENLAGGRITIEGHAGDDLGSHMSGGAIVIHGDAGDRTGAARPGAKKGMTGGEIVIFGSAGDFTGASLRRGVIAVAGNIGESALHAALAGTVLALGDVGASPVRFNKRGSLVTYGHISPPATYRRACAYRPTFVRLLLRHLQRTYKFAANDQHFTQLFERYCGDFAEMGRGEILAPAKPLT